MKRVCTYVYNLYDLRGSTYDLYKNPGNHSVFINKNISNNNFEGVVQDRNKEIFQKAGPVYFEALEKSGFNECYTQKTDISHNTSKKQQKRKMIYIFLIIKNVFFH